MSAEPEAKWPPRIIFVVLFSLFVQICKRDKIAQINLFSVPPVVLASVSCLEHKAEVPQLCCVQQQRMLYVVGAAD